MSKPSKARRFLWLGSGIVLIAILVWGFTPKEPAYKGRNISTWLKNYPQFKQQDWREVEAAIQTFGTNGIPYILKAFTDKNSVWKNAHGRLWMQGPLWLKKAIGPPDLRRLDPAYAPEIFAAIGPSSIPALIDALKQDNQTVQMAASQALGYFGPTAEPALPELKRCLARCPAESGPAFYFRKSIAQIEPKATPKEVVPNKSETNGF